MNAPQDSHILVVDDLPALRAVLSSQLQNAGYKVKLAVDGEQGWEMFQKEPPSMVISDVEMPKMNGFDLCRKIKFEYQGPLVPVGLVTAHVTEDFLLKGMEAGADVYLTRPYQLDVLLEQLELALQKGAWNPRKTRMESVQILDKSYELSTDWAHLANMMTIAYRAVIHQNRMLDEAKEALGAANKELEKSQAEVQRLLSNTMPPKIAHHLMTKGWVMPESVPDCTVMFTDFVGFTRSVESMKPAKLIKNLDHYFEFTDKLTEKYRLEKIKTIGDSYMIASGVPEYEENHAIRSILAGLELINFIELKTGTDFIVWPVRIGVHTGSVIAGIIGQKRIAYDLWGSNVNLASRMESRSLPNTITISPDTYKRVEQYVDVTEDTVEGLSISKVYRVVGLKEEFADVNSKKMANQKWLATILS